MIFVIAAIFILVISFVIALFSLIREQSKIEKAVDDVSEGADQINTQQSQTIEKKAPEHDLTNLNVSQSLPQFPLQTQTQTQGEDLNALHLAQKPWWEKEIQKRNEESSGSVIDWQNTSQVQHPTVVDVLKTEESGKVIESQNNFGVQTPRKKDQHLQGSFSVSDLAKQD